MSRQKRIASMLTVLKPHYLEVINDSHFHSNHQHSPGSGDSHFTIKISAAVLAGKSKIQQHKMINEILKDEFANGLHALSIKVSTEN